VYCSEKCLCDERDLTAVFPGPYLEETWFQCDPRQPLPCCMVSSGSTSRHATATCYQTLTKSVRITSDQFDSRSTTGKSEAFGLFYITPGKFRDRTRMLSPPFPI